MFDIALEVKNIENIWNVLKDTANSGIKLFFPVHPRTKKHWKIMV